MNLIAPEPYKVLTEEEKKSICNGCGARDGIDVPDSILRLSIKESCHLHDYYYSIGITQEDKEEADQFFFLNMLKQIESGNRFLVSFRIAIAYGYYCAVRDFGNKAFWEGKL